MIHITRIRNVSVKSPHNQIEYNMLIMVILEKNIYDIDCKAR